MDAVEKRLISDEEQTVVTFIIPTTHPCEKCKNNILVDYHPYLQLVFRGNKMIPFCTIRRETKEKALYYRDKIGQEFEVVVKEGD